MKESRCCDAALLVCACAPVAAQAAAATASQGIIRSGNGMG